MSESKPEGTEKFRILLGCTGSVASIKLVNLIGACRDVLKEVDIRIIVTENALHFIDLAEVEKLGVEVLRDQHEWQAWQKRGDPVLHIELRKWADALVIAPLDANTLAKIANGICDNLLTCVARAWDPSKPLLFAPAMNTYMWEHPLTARQTAALRDFGYTEIPCIEKVLMCKDKGFGAMAEVPTIVDFIEKAVCK